MPLNLRNLSVAAATWIALGTAVASAQWGTLKGRFVFDGKAPTPAKLNITKDEAVCGPPKLVDESLVVGADGGIKNVVVYCRTKGVKVNPAAEAEANKATPVMDNKDCRFEPHILPMLVTQTLEIKNSDPMIAHNSNISPQGDQGANPLIPAGGSAKMKFNRAQTLPQPVSCNIHPWMKGYVLARDNPYFAVSKPDGSFEIKDLPVGKLEFQAWQEKSGYVDTKDWKKGRFEVTIKAGDNDLGTIKVPASLFNK